jgi:hypothetical protein
MPDGAGHQRTRHLLFLQLDGRSRLEAHQEIPDYP